MVLLPTFRLPTLIHTRSGNAKWLYEISHTNPLWIHPEDAARLGVATGDLLKVATRIGHFVDKVWVTEGMRPGRRRVLAPPRPLAPAEDAGGERWSTALVDLQQARRRASGACARSTACGRSRATIRTPSASGGTTPACTRT